MFIYFAENYTQYFSFLNIFNYITFRTGAAILTSLLFTLIFGEMIIKYLSNFQPKGQPIRKDGPQRHIIEKAGTPTMGGVLILSSILISVFIWSDLKNVFIWITLLATVSFGLIGLIDDYKKIKSLSSKGMKASSRVILQVVLSFVIIFLIYQNLPEELNSVVSFPFFKNLIIDLGLFFFPLGIFIIIGSANSVNLTDGLDGLAIVPVLIVALSFGLISYVCGNVFSSCCSLCGLHDVVHHVAHDVAHTL